MFLVSIDLRTKYAHCLVLTIDLELQENVNDEDFPSIFFDFSLRGL